MTVTPASNKPPVRTSKPPTNSRSEKKDAKRSHFSALALSKTRFVSKKRTQTNPLPRTLSPVKAPALELHNPPRQPTVAENSEVAHLRDGFILRLGNFVGITEPLDHIARQPRHRPGRL